MQRPLLLLAASLLGLACTPTAYPDPPAISPDESPPTTNEGESPPPSSGATEEAVASTEPEAEAKPEAYAPLWTSETGDWNHGVLVLDSGDVISQSMWRMRVHARHDGTILRTAKTCGARRSSGFVQSAPDKALLTCDDELREYNLPSLASQTLIRFPFDADVAAVGTTQVAIASRDNEVAVLDLATSAEVLRFKSNEDVEALALSPDGQALALGLDDTGIVLRELSTGNARTLVPNDTAEPAWFRADGTELIAEVDSFTVGAVEIPSGRILRTYDVSSWLTTARYIDAGHVLATGAHGASILKPNGSQLELSDETGEGAGVSPDGRTLCWGDRDGTITCWSKDKPAPSELDADALAPVSHNDASGSASQASPGALEGKIVRKIGAKEVVVKLSGSPKPAVGATGQLSKAIDQMFGNMKVSGWMEVAEVEVVRVDGDEIRLKITKRSSEVVVNGKKVDHFVGGTKIQLSF